MDRVEIGLDAHFMTESQANEARQKFADYKKRQSRIAAALLPPRTHQQLLKHVAQHATKFANSPQVVQQEKSNAPQSSAFLPRMFSAETKKDSGSKKQKPANPMPVTSIGPAPAKLDLPVSYNEWKKQQAKNLPDVWKKVDANASLLAEEEDDDDQMADDEAEIEFKLPKSLEERTKVVYAAEQARRPKDDIGSPHVPQGSPKKEHKSTPEDAKKSCQPQPITSEASTFSSPKAKNDLTLEIPETPVSNITGSFAQDLSCRIDSVHSVNSSHFLSAKSYFSSTEPDAVVKQPMPAGSDDDALGKRTQSNHKLSTQCQTFQRPRHYMGTNQEIIEQYSMLRRARGIDRWLTEGEAFALMALLMGIICALLFRAYFLEE